MGFWDKVESGYEKIESAGQKFSEFADREQTRVWRNLRPKIRELSDDALRYKLAQFEEAGNSYAVEEIEREMRNRERNAS